MGLCLGIVMLFMNGMLLTSWLFSSLFSTLGLVLLTQKLLPEASIVLRSCLLIPSFLGATFALKTILSLLLHVEDDVSIHS